MDEDLNRKRAYGAPAVDALVVMSFSFCLIDALEIGVWLRGKKPTIMVRTERTAYPGVQTA